MDYQEFEPPSYLADLIRYYWVLEDHPETSGSATFRVLADGYPGFIFTYGNRSSWQPVGDPTDEIPQCFFYGILQQFQDISVSGPYGILGISFYAHSFHTILDIPVNRLTNESIEADALYGSKGRQLTKRLRSTADNQERIIFLNLFLQNTRRERDQGYPAVQQGLHRMAKQQESMGELTQHLGISRRHFERIFKSVVGTSPKRYSRLLRFQQTLRQPINLEEQRLTDLAFQCGFSDQSHFIREFKAFAGFNPKQFFSERDSEVVENFVHLSG